jgi:hypothetical protein
MVPLLFLSPFGAPALACWVILRPLGLCAFLTVGPPSPPRTPSGLPRCPRARSDRDGCPLYSGGAVPTRPAQAIRPSLAASQRPTPGPRCCFPPSRAWHNAASSRVHSRSPVRSSPLPVTPGWNGSPWASPLGFTPRRYQRRMPKWDGHSGTCPESRHRHQPALPNASTRHADPRVARLPTHHPDPSRAGPTHPHRSPPTPRHRSGRQDPHQIDDAPDLTWGNGTRQHGADGGKATSNPPVVWQSAARADLARWGRSGAASALRSWGTTLIYAVRSSRAVFPGQRVDSSVRTGHLECPFKGLPEGSNPTSSAAHTSR